MYEINKIYPCLPRWQQYLHVMQFHLLSNRATFKIPKCKRHRYIEEYRSRPFWFSIPEEGCLHLPSRLHPARYPRSQPGEVIEA